MLDYKRDILPYLLAVVGDVPADQDVPAPGGVGPDGAPLVHAYRAEAIKLRDEIRAVFSDEYPEYLDLNRPGEKKKNKDYRKSVYRNPMRGLADRVIEALDYIRQADDFSVVFPPAPNGAAENSLQVYTGEGFSDEGDAIEWFFKKAVPAYVYDPNAAMLTLTPLDEHLGADGLFGAQDRYANPRHMLIPCQDVWQWQRGKQAVVVAPERSLLTDALGAKRLTGVVLYFMDHESYAIARQTSITSGSATAATPGPGTPSVVWEVTGLSQVIDPVSLEPVQRFQALRHYRRGLPAVRLGRKRKKENARGEEYYESILADAMAFVKEAQQDMNDKQVEKNHHVSSLEYLYVTKKCTNARCVGGKIPLLNEKNKPVFYPNTTMPQLVDCPTCGGSGLDTTSGSGLDKYYISMADGGSMMAPGANGGKMPNVPGGFIPRPIEALQEFRKELSDNTLAAFRTLDMQFIFETPQEVSGASKRYDREGMYRKLNTEAQHLLSVARTGYVWIDALRYGPSGKAGQQVPSLQVPVRFNLENAELTRLELNDALLNKYDTTVIEALTLKYLEYTVGKEGEQYKRYLLRAQADPCKDMPDDMKLYVLGTNVTLMEDDEKSRATVERVYLSIFFDGIVQDATLEHADYWNLPLARQKEILIEINKRLVGKLSAAVVSFDEAGNPVLNSQQFNAPAKLQNLSQTRTFTNNSPGQN